MRESAKTALAVVAVLAIAGAFWLLLLGPKRDKASELSEQTVSLSAEVSAEEARVSEAEQAKAQFPADYRQLVLLGKAVPAEAATPSLLVQLNGIGDDSRTRFVSISLGGEAGEGEAAGVEGEERLPLGAGIGVNGLPVMSYTLQFKGGYFGIAEFVERLDSLVQTKNGGVDAHGRLVTINEFTLAPEEQEGGSAGELIATFQVTTYVTPPGQGLTAGASPSGPTGEGETP